MLAPAQIRDVIARKYGAFLRSVVDGASFFPLPVRFGKPSTGAGFAELKSDIEALAQPGTGYRIEWREVNSRKLSVGRQKFPEKVWFESEDDYLRAIGKVREVARFREQLEEARHVCPEAIAWMRDRPVVAAENAPVWSHLLQVCAWLKAHPRPGCYARELPLPIGTKFIDDNKAVLRELLPYVLAPETIRPDAADFETRFGFRYDEAPVRMRILDRSAAPLGWPAVITDFSVPHTEFVGLEWPARRVLIVENKFTFLSLPKLPEVLAVWGAGAALQLLCGADWLGKRDLYYWGDLDVAGFHLLNRLRRAFGHATSIMMDEETMRQFWRTGIPCIPPSADETDQLSAAERATCAVLRTQKLRLEQEKFPHLWTVARLQRIIGP